MKCTKIMLSGLVAFAATANAMPTLEETKKVEPLVADLMRDDQAALKSGKKTRVESDKMLDIVDRLVKEYDMVYAIHNHGPDIPYLFPTAEAAIKRMILYK